MANDRTKRIAGVDVTEEPVKKCGKTKATTAEEQSDGNSSENSDQESCGNHYTPGNSANSATLQKNITKEQQKRKRKAAVIPKTTKKPLNIQQQVTKIQTSSDTEDEHEDPIETEKSINKTVDTQTAAVSSNVNNKSSNHQSNSPNHEPSTANEEPQHNETSMNIKKGRGVADIKCGNGIRIKIRRYGVVIITPSNERIYVKPDGTNMETKGCELDVKDGIVSIKSDKSDELESVFNYTK